MLSGISCSEFNATNESVTMKYVLLLLLLAIAAIDWTSGVTSESVDNADSNVNRLRLFGGLILKREREEKKTVEKTMKQS